MLNCLFYKLKGYTSILAAEIIYPLSFHFHSFSSKSILLILPKMEIEVCTNMCGRLKVIFLFVRDPIVFKKKLNHVFFPPFFLRLIIGE